MTTEEIRRSRDRAVIASKLLERIADLAAHLFPNGHQEGNHWRVGSVNGEHGHSFDIVISGPKAGLWGDWSEKADNKKSRNPINLWMAARGCDFKTALEEAATWLGEPCESGSSTAKAKGFLTLENAITFMAGKLDMLPKRRDAYPDRDGNKDFVMVRFEGHGEKDFRPFHQNESGRWIIGDPPGPLPLFRLTQLLQPRLRATDPLDEFIFVVEGEGCVSDLETVNLVATTSAHGSKSPHKSDWSPLAGRKVVILPDNDDTGRVYAWKVAAFLLQLSPQAEVRILALPNLPPKGDCKEWLDARDAQTPEEIRAELLGLIRKAEVIKKCPKTDNHKKFPDPIPWARLKEPPDRSSYVLENGFLELGSAFLMVGPSGVGKTIACLQTCACWSAGLAGLHIGAVRPLKISILQTEDSENDLRTYLQGILSMECFTEEHRALVEQNLLIMEPAAGGSPEYLKELLEDNIARFRPDVVGLNPLMAFCGHDYTRELGAMLYQVVDPVMKKHRVAFVGVHHVIKPIYRKDTSSYGAYDYQYLAAGDARIANFPRASLQIDPVSTNPVVTACFRITKRWQRVAWLNEHGEPTHERYLKHSTDRIAWIDATEEEVNEARAAEQPREILEILPPPSEEGIIREEIRLRGKNEFGWGKNKTDDYLKIVLHDGLAERYEGTTEANRKEALFRRKYE